MFVYMKKRWTYFFYIFSLCFTSSFIGHVRAARQQAIKMIELQTFSKTTRNSTQNTQKEDHKPIISPTQSNNNNTERLRRYSVLDILQEHTTEQLNPLAHTTASESSYSVDSQPDDEHNADAARTDSDHDDHKEKAQEIPPFGDSTSKIIYEDVTSQDSQGYNLLYSQTNYPFWWEKKDHKDSCRSKASYCEDGNGHYYIVTAAEDGVVFFNTKEPDVKCEELFASESHMQEQQCTLKTTESAAFWVDKKNNYTLASKQGNDSTYYVSTPDKKGIICTDGASYEKPRIMLHFFQEEMLYTLYRLQKGIYCWQVNNGNYTFANTYTSPTHDYIKYIGQDKSNQFIRFTKKETTTSVTYDVVYTQNEKHLLRLQVDDPDARWWWCDEHNKSLQKAKSYQLKGKNVTWIESYQQYNIIAITDNKPSLITISTTFSRNITIGVQENKQLYFVLQFTAGGKTTYLYHHHPKHYLEALEGWVCCQAKDTKEAQADDKQSRLYIANNTTAEVAGAGHQDHQAVNDILFYHKDKQEVIYLVLGKKDQNGVYKSTCFEGTLYTTGKPHVYSTTLILGNNPQQLPQEEKHFHINAQTQTYTLSNQASGDKALNPDLLAISNAGAAHIDPHKQSLDISDHQGKSTRIVREAASPTNDHLLHSPAFAGAHVAADKDTSPNAKSIYTAFADKYKAADTPILSKAAAGHIKGSNMDEQPTLNDPIRIECHDDAHTLDLFTRQKGKDTQEEKHFHINAQTQTYTLSNQASGDKALTPDPLAISHADAAHIEPHKKALDTSAHQGKSTRIVRAAASLTNDHRLHSPASTGERIANPSNVKSIYTAFTDKYKAADTPILRKAAAGHIKGSNIDEQPTLNDPIRLAYHDDAHTLDLFTRQREKDTPVFVTWQYTPTAAQENTSYIDAAFFPSKVDPVRLTAEGNFDVNTSKKKNWEVFGKHSWIFKKNGRRLPFVAILFWILIALALIATTPKLVEYFLDVE